MFERNNCRHRYFKTTNQIFFGQLFGQLLMRKSQLLMKKQAALLNVNIQRRTCPNWLKSHWNACNKNESQESGKPISEIWIRSLTIFKKMDYPAAQLFFLYSPQDLLVRLTPSFPFLRILQHNITL